MVSSNDVMNRIRSKISQREITHFPQNFNISQSCNQGVGGDNSPANFSPSKIEMTRSQSQPKISLFVNVKKKSLNVQEKAFSSSLDKPQIRNIKTPNSEDVNNSTNKKPSNFKSVLKYRNNVQYRKSETSRPTSQTNTNLYYHSLSNNFKVNYYRIRNGQRLRCEEKVESSVTSSTKN